MLTDLQLSFERRRLQRLPVRAPAVLHLPGRNIDIVVEEISSIGMRIRCASVLRVGAELSTSLPGDRRARAARVVHCDDRQTYGCEFYELLSASEIAPLLKIGAPPEAAPGDTCRPSAATPTRAFAVTPAQAIGFAALGLLSIAAVSLWR